MPPPPPPPLLGVDENDAKEENDAGEPAAEGAERPVRDDDDGGREILGVVPADAEGSKRLAASHAFLGSRL